MSIILFLIVLAVLIFVHELGHFVAAKLAKIRVDEFSIGFPPRIFKKKVGETLYSLSLIPFGGYVKIFGENPNDESLHGAEKSRAFSAKPRYIQAIVLIAGIFMNFLFAAILLSGSFMLGQAVKIADWPNYADRIEPMGIVVLSVLAETPASDAGFEPGDRIHSVAGDNEITIEEIQTLIAESTGKSIAVTVERNDEEKEIVVIPEEGIIEDKGAIGISMENVGKLHLPLHLAIKEGVVQTVYLTKAVAVGLYDLAYDAIHGRPDLSNVTGPIGIANLVGDASELGVAYLLTFVAVISINLAVINLIPFPALDGGRLLFVIIEGIIRRPVSYKIQNAFNGIGFVILILLMIVITFRDVARIW